MKKFLPLLFILIVACSDDDKVLTDHPPFDDYMLVLQFWHTPGTSTYEAVDAFSSTAKLKDSNPYAGDYYYSNKLNSDGQMSGSTLKVTTKESHLFVVEISGVLGRWGTKVPTNYTGDQELWNSVACNYKVLIECNPSTEEIIAASYEVWNEKFKFKEDITSRMRISNYEEYENLWRITSDDQQFNPDANFSISVRLVK